MLRINLLPAYFAERRKLRATTALVTAIFALFTVGMLWWFMSTKTAVEQREVEANDKEIEAQRVTAIEQETQQIRTGIQPILDKVNFVEAVLAYNGLRQKVYRRAAAYTVRNVEYNQMAVNGDTLNMSAFAEDISDIGRYLIMMFGNPDVTAVSVSGVPGWPSGNAGGAAAGGRPGGLGGGFAGGGGLGGYPGGGGGSGYPGGGGGSGFPGSGGPGVGGGIPGGFPGGAGGAPGALAQNPARKGYPFSVVARLVQPVAPPQLPGSLGGGNAAGGGGFGGYPGGGGGSGFPGSGGPGFGGSGRPAGAPGGARPAL